MCINNWTDLLHLSESQFSIARPSDVGTGFNNRLWEEPLLTQSNGRVLLGHSCTGSLRFITLPTQVYPVPIQNKDYGYGQGMFYHTDNVMYVGDLSWSIVMNGSRVDLADVFLPSVTKYRMHFLPITKLNLDTLEIAVISCAPVANSGVEAFGNTPLPGPSGAVYAILLTNVSNAKQSGIIELSASNRLIGDYEDFRDDIWQYNQAQTMLRRNTLMLTRPEGAAGLHVHGGNPWKKNAGGSYISDQAFEIDAGMHLVVYAWIALASDYSGVTPALYELSRTDPLKWIKQTVNFWKPRLGEIKVYASPDAQECVEHLQEFNIRNMLDNFNCLQTDSQGNLLCLRQGAPSHGYGTIWGIDLEPTIISVAYICPEMAERALLFIKDKTRPTSSYCFPDHSLPILCAPIVIAHFLLRHDGNTKLFENNNQLLPSLKDIADEIISMKHPKYMLFPTRWSSDGTVGRRYDYGTNIKLWYAFKGLAYIYKSLDLDSESSYYTNIADSIKQAIENTMVLDGPFGRQISGGTNLDSDPKNFYLNDNVPYYDGEDTSSMLAPIYGITDWTDDHWVNYQRFGRSLFCPNYEVEHDGRTWYATAPLALDGTALLASVAGSVNVAETVETTRTLRKYIDPVTGSLYWWPSGTYESRKLTRCSQGVGAWVWQYWSQWLGLDFDYMASTLTIAPRGLIRSYSLENLNYVNFPFDINVDESSQTMSIMNKSNKTIKIKAGFRSPGEMAENELDWIEDTVQPKTSLQIKRRTPARSSHIDTFCAKDIHEREFALLGDREAFFIRRGDVWYYDINRIGKPPIDLRFIIGNPSPVDWQSVTVQLDLPDGCSATARKSGYRQIDSRLEKLHGSAYCNWGKLAAGDRVCAPFSLFPPILRHPINIQEENISKHAPGQPENNVVIQTDEIKTSEVYHLSATMVATDKNGSLHQRKLLFTVSYVPRQ